MKPILFFDTETFSEANLKQTGSAKYARDPSTELLMITWGFDTGPVYYHDVANGGALPFELVMALTDPAYLKCAANMTFDRAIMKFVAGIEIPWSQCIDSHVQAFAMSFSGGLGSMGEQMGLPDDKTKLKEGRKLLLRFCKLQPKSHNVSRWTKENSPEEWQQFSDYAIRDTEAMREQWMVLAPYDPVSDWWWEAWRMTQEMNERGMPVDPQLVDQAIEMAALRKNEIKAQMIKLTGLDNPNSVQQLLAWLDTQSLALPNLQAATIDNLIPKLQPSKAKEVLKMKRIIGQTAVTKWTSIKRMLCSDNTIKGMFIFMGASRTWRYASRGINLQNLRRPPKGGMDNLIKLVYYGDSNLINLIHGEPLDFLARTVRGAITAPKGSLLAVPDINSIESVLLGWLTGCKRMNNIFASGKDTYKDFATELFSVHYDDVNSDQRTFSKPPVLGAGYMMGAQGLQTYARDMGVDMTVKRSAEVVYLFRSIYPEVPIFWDWIKRAWDYVVSTGQPCTGYRLTLKMEHDFLRILLPSGRYISYFQPRVSEPRTIYMPNGDEFEAMSPSYMGLDRRANSAASWERIWVHAGSYTENIIQAIALDVLVTWMMRLRDIDLVGTVHDEVIAVCEDVDDNADLTLDYMTDKLREPIPWAPDLKLSAEGFVGKHYDK